MRSGNPFLQKTLARAIRWVDCGAVRQLPEICAARQRSAITTAMVSVGCRILLANVLQGAYVVENVRYMGAESPVNIAKLPSISFMR